MLHKTTFWPVWNLLKSHSVHNLVILISNIQIKIYNMLVNWNNENWKFFFQNLNAS